MQDISIARRLKVGLGSQAGIILVLAMISVASSLYLSGAFATYRGQSDVVTAANHIAKDVFEAEIAAGHFRRVPDAAYREAFGSSMDALSAEVARLAEAPDIGPEIRRVLEGITAAESAYRQSFEQVQSLDAELDRSEAAFYEAGATARRTLSDFMQVSNRAGDADRTYAAASAQQDLLLARLYMARFVLTEDTGILDGARSYLAEAGQKLSRMRAAIGSGPRADRVATAAEQMARVVELADEVGAAALARARAYDRMDQSRDAIMAQTETLKEGAAGQLSAIGANMDRMSIVTSSLLVVAAIASLVYAAVLAHRMTRAVGREFESTLACVDELARGNLEVRIEGTERNTELGRIAKALDEMRLRGREAEDLARRTEEEKKRAAAEKAKREAAEREAEQRRAMEEQQAAERHKREIFDTLRSALSGVVAAAAAGDFSRRVDTHALDPELVGFAEEINRLMSTVETGLSEIAKVSARLAERDLRDGMRGEYSGTFRELQGNIETMIGSLSALFTEIAQQTDTVAQQSDDMMRNAEELARRAESQAASLEQTSASMTEIASSAESNAGSAADTNKAASAMESDAARAKDVLQSTITAMRDIEDGSKEIEAIVDVIEDIAFQTNLLSLNASVEAARAGEAGKGFAVVANEVRALAQRSAEASSKVQTIIAQSTGAISRGSDAVEQTGVALEQIVERIGTVSGNLREIKSASVEQATAVKDISNAFAQLDKITQRNAAAAEDTRGSAGLLAAQSSRMKDAVAKVRLRDAPPGQTPDIEARPSRDAA